MDTHPMDPHSYCMQSQFDFEIPTIVNALCKNEHLPQENKPTPWLHDHMPSQKILNHMIEKICAVLFPNYFSHFDLRRENLAYHIGAMIDTIGQDLHMQILRALLSTSKQDQTPSYSIIDTRAAELARAFLHTLPDIRQTLLTDMQAHYDGDPAAQNYAEIMMSYPGMQSIIHHRLAHTLHQLDVPLLPRMISEYAHSKTGIDIHPGAQIGSHFFIDHGTGVVIGETSIIGHHVRMFQGVTLGAKSFPRDANGNPIKGIPRHPIIEDNVVIYSGATILGRITIGSGSVIGGNVWITKSVPPASLITQGSVRESRFSDGDGI